MLTAELATERASLMFRSLALPIEAGEHVDAQIRRAARKVGFEHSRGRKIWYALAKQILAHEWEALKAAQRKHARERDERHRAEMQQLNLTIEGWGA